MSCPVVAKVFFYKHPRLPDDPDLYTGEAPDTLVDSGGNLSVLEGTRVELSGTANNGTDYALIEDRVTIPAGATNANITITPNCGARFGNLG